MASERILVTGASGFIGTHLIEALRRRRPTAAIYSVGMQKPSGPEVTHVVADLTDEGATRSAISRVAPGAVFHLAGSARVSEDHGMQEYFERNFLTTVHVIRALEAVPNPTRLFFASSVHVYGNAAGTVDESTTLSPAGFYGFSKYLAEQVVAEFALRSTASAVVVGRLYSCIGPGQAPGFVTTDLCQRLRQLAPGEKLTVGSVDSFRRFLDVRDVVGIMESLLARAKPGFDAVNIASPFELTVESIARSLIAVSGVRTELEPRASADNAFKGLRLDLQKLHRLVPDAHFRPIEQTLKDIWDASSGRRA